MFNARAATRPVYGDVSGPPDATSRRDELVMSVAYQLGRPPRQGPEGGGRPGCRPRSPVVAMWGGVACATHDTLIARAGSFERRFKYRVPRRLTSVGLHRSRRLMHRRLLPRPCPAHRAAQELAPNRHAVAAAGTAVVPTKGATRGCGQPLSVRRHRSPPAPAHDRPRPAGCVHANRHHGGTDTPGARPTAPALDAPRAHR